MCRRPGAVAFGALGTLGFAVGLVLAVVDDGVDGVNAGLTNKAVGAVVIATMAWLGWGVTLYPRVEVRSSALIVRQPFLSYTAPWYAVGAPDALDGLRVPLAGHGVVKPWAFSSSLLADLTGERAANKAVMRIEEGRRQAVGGQRRGERHVERHVDRHVALGLAPLGLTWLFSLATAVLASLV